MNEIVVEKPRVRVKATSQPAAEGEPRDGPWLIQFPPSGVLPNAWGSSWNYWQMGRDPVEGNGNGAVLWACISAYMHAISQCSFQHWRATGDGGRVRVDDSAIARLLRKPNGYQSRSDFISILVRDVLSQGNAYAMARFNGRFEAVELHTFDPAQSKAVVGAEEAIFYQLAGNSVIEGPQSSYWGTYGRSGHLVVPQREVLHVKMDSKPSNPLEGRAPWRHAVSAVALQELIGHQLLATFGSGSRPSGVITTDNVLTSTQVTELRQRINEAWRTIDNLGGGPPILTAGLKWQGVSQTAKDTELSAAARLSADWIYAAFGIPPAVLGMTDRSTYASTEALIQSWLASGLGGLLDLIETTFDQFFGLAGWPIEFVEADTSALLRSQFKDRVEALTRGIQGGLFAPNEARRTEELGSVTHGDQVLVQQQMVPLGWEPPQQTAPAPAPASEPESVSFSPAIIRREFSRNRP